MACDLACLHCRAEAIARKDPRRLTTDDGKSLLREVKDSGNPSPIVVLTGGDPFKRDDIFELVEPGRIWQRDWSADGSFSICDTASDR